MHRGSFSTSRRAIGNRLRTAGPSVKFMVAAIRALSHALGVSWKRAEPWTCWRPRPAASRDATSPRSRLVDASWMPMMSGASARRAGMASASRSSRCSLRPVRPEKTPPWRTFRVTTERVGGAAAGPWVAVAAGAVTGRVVPKTRPMATP
ncbi:MAG: hypothetical protein DMD79_05400, partial [Candidatus Rokuibacteriota bacterium]